MPYEVQTYTIANGWKNEWFYDEGDGHQTETFATAEEAEAALAEHLQDIRDELLSGYIGPYDFRIQYVPETQIQPAIINQEGETT